MVSLAKYFHAFAGTAHWVTNTLSTISPSFFQVCLHFTALVAPAFFPIIIMNKKGNLVAKFLWRDGSLPLKKWKFYKLAYLFSVFTCEVLQVIFCLQLK